MKAVSGNGSRVIPNHDEEQVEYQAASAPRAQGQPGHTPDQAVIHPDATAPTRT